MEESIKEAYWEVDKILSLMKKEDVLKIPEPIREIFKNKKSKTYQKQISNEKPLKDQNLKKETLEILAILNYNFWCKEENRKKKLIQKYYNNEIEYQKQLREKYNPDKIFKNKRTI